MSREKLLLLCEEVASDVANDAVSFDGKPFTGKVIGEYFGHHGAAIAALANIIKEILENPELLK